MEPEPEAIPAAEPPSDGERSRAAGGAAPATPQNAEGWTCEQVVEWLRAEGLGAEVCETFRAQNINGSHLLGMAKISQRVESRLSLKVGDMLDIESAVARLIEARCTEAAPKPPRYTGAAAERIAVGTYNDDHPGDETARKETLMTLLSNRQRRLSEQAPPRLPLLPELEAFRASKLELPQRSVAELVDEAQLAGLIDASAPEARTLLTPTKYFPNLRSKIKDSSLKLIGICVPCYNEKVPGLKNTLDSLRGLVVPRGFALSVVILMDGKEGKRVSFCDAISC